MMKLISKMLSLSSNLKMAVRDILFLAVDCEGDSLSRKGALTIITVATEEKCRVCKEVKRLEDVQRSREDN